MCRTTGPRGGGRRPCVIKPAMVMVTRPTMRPPTRTTGRRRARMKLLLVLADASLHVFQVAGRVLGTSEVLLGAARAAGGDGNVAVWSLCKSMQGTCSVH